jgi:hypothetical protein
MPGLMTLVCPPGAADGLISHGTQHFAPYRENHRNPDSRWLVDVPSEAAQHLLYKGGFGMPVTTQTLFGNEPVQAPADPGVGGTRAMGLTIVRHESDPGASLGSYARRLEDGVSWLVHSHMVGQVMAHGFRPTGDAVPAGLIEKDERDDEIARLKARLAELEEAAEKPDLIEPGDEREMGRLYEMAGEKDVQVDRRWGKARLRQELGIGEDEPLPARSEAPVA